MENSEDGSWKACDRVYTNEKAGMSEVDKDWVKKTVYEMSKDSEHFKNEERKQKTLELRIDRLKQSQALLTETQLAEFTKFEFSVMNFSKIPSGRRMDALMNFEPEEIWVRRGFMSIWMLSLPP